MTTAAGRAALLAPGDGRASSVPARVLAMLALELRLILRRPENLFVTVGLPAILLVFFGSMAGLPASATTVPGARPIDAALPAILATAVVAAGLVNLGIATAYERSYGVIKRLGGSPLTRGQLVAAKILAILVVEAAQALLLCGIAVVVFGWTPGEGWNPAGAVLALGLGAAAFAALGLLLAGTLRAEATMAAANALFLVGMLVGGLLVPADQLPGVLGSFASVLPSAALADALRIGMGAATGALAEPLLLLAAWALGLGLATARTFRWE